MRWRAESLEAEERLSTARDNLLLALAEHALGPGARGNQERLREALEALREVIE